MEPDRIGVATDEFIPGKAVDRQRSLHTLLFSIDKDNHELLAPLLSRALLGGRKLTFRFSHLLLMGLHEEKRVQNLCYLCDLLLEMSGRFEGQEMRQCASRTCEMASNDHET